MCLAVPGRVVSVEGADPAFRHAHVDFCGVRRIVNLAFTPDVVPGDFVLVHAGVALTRVDEAEAARTFQYLAQIGALEEEGRFEPDIGKCARLLLRPPGLKQRRHEIGRAHV